ncbi:MAG TPA: efflux RND transporter permease subunit, partial [Myxococcota bacterium]|nr:efflux RND transporter permease subunit [Myxococcota bacterium]
MAEPEPTRDRLGLLGAILDWSLRNRAIVIVMWGIIAVSGVLAALVLPLDAFPDTTPIQVQVNTTAEALGPLEIERRISAPIEAAIGGLPGLVEVRSVAKFGFSQVTATFEDGVEIAAARQGISERLMTVSLDPGLGPPQLGPTASGLGEVFQYLVYGDRTSAELRAIQDLQIRPRLRTVAGVAEVNSWGGDEARVEVRVDPDRLRRWSIDLPALTESIEANIFNVSGGPLDVGGEGALVQGIALPTSIEQLAALVVATREGVPVRLGQLAELAEGRQIRRGAVTANGQGEVVLGIGFAMLGANGHEVTQELRARLDEVRRTLPQGVFAKPVYERTDLVDRVLTTAGVSLLEGGILVIVIIFLFLGNLRAGLLVAAVIPLSMLVASNLMLAAGVAGSL